MEPTQTMKRAVEAWGEADARQLLALLDDEVVWKTANTMQSDRFRFGGEYRGRDAVVAYLSKVSTVYYFTSCTARELVSDRNIVWGLFDVTGEYVAPGGGHERRTIRFECAMRWRLRDGKIVEAQLFYDTLALLAQQGELPRAA